MTSIHWFTISRRTLERAEPIVRTILKDPFLSQTQISNLTGIPRPTVCRIINKLAEIGAIKKITVNIAGNRVYKYEVDPRFYEFLSKNISTNVECSNRKGRGFPTGAHQNATAQGTHSSNSCTKAPNASHPDTQRPPLITRPDDEEELEKWVKNGLFRIHGFQRKFTLHNYWLKRDDEKWDKLAQTLDGTLKKLRIGRGKSGVMYIVEVWNDTLKTHLSIQFRPNSMIISLPRKKSIYVPWESFNYDLERIIVEEVKMLAERAIKAYTDIFNQQVLMKDSGWVGRKKPLKPEVAYIDPDGVVRKVHEVEGATYIDGLGYWVDGSIKSDPELEFDSVETASKFKKAVDILASGELEEKVSRIENHVSELESKVVEAVTAGVQKATEQLAVSMLSGQRPVQDQLNEMWRRIADMQESINLFMMYQLAEKNGNKKLAEALFDKLIKKLGLEW